MKTTEDLSNDEIKKRVAILKRFKVLLNRQREKFREYLDVLQAQEISIENENIDAILEHTELEKNIISEIYTIQKVIDPMEEMYKYTNPNDNGQAIELKTDLKKLQTMVLEQNEKNRKKLKTHMVGLRKQIDALKTPYKGKTSVFAESNETASMIDIQV
ncbi:MAG: flagellar biosynthesis protein FlgN [Treponema sp.]|nr:MAG: flagellar biosynthesis protein FlgN [Treponema sp.]